MQKDGPYVGFQSVDFDAFLLVKMDIKAILFNVSVSHLASGVIVRPKCL